MWQQGANSVATTKNTFSSLSHPGFIKIKIKRKANDPMAAEERVLCFKRELFEKLGVFQGISLEVDKYLPVVTAASNTIYLNRTEAEQDKRYKQLIPYALILCKDRILRYRRGRGGQE